MAGASLALMLAHYCPQLSVTMLERRPLPDVAASVQLPSFDTRATAVAAGSLQIFDELGLWPQLRDYAAPIEHVHVSDRGRALGARLDAREQRRASFAGVLGAVIENAALGPILHGALSRTGVRLQAPAQVERVQMTDAGARLRWRGDSDAAEQLLEARLLVVADGVDSPLCRQLGIESERIDYRQRALVTTIGLERDHRNRAYERFTEAGPMALLPLPKRDGLHRMALVWTGAERAAEALAALPQADFVARLQRTFGWRAGRFVRAGGLQDYPLSLSVAREQWRRSLVLVGNCAHFLHPVAGQGFNLTMRDCYGLAQALRESGLASESTQQLGLLEAYGRGRQRDQQLTIGFSDRIPPLFASGNPLLRGLRQAGLLGLMLAPPLRSGFVGQAAGFGL